MRSTNLRFLLAAAVLMLSAIGAASCNDDSSGARPRGGGVPDVLRVGTAGDYPPFSYYAESDAHELSMTGFDVDLIRAVGDELGSEIEISDFAFDGLLEALRIGQVDAVIAAMSVTPDRQALVAFSDVYYVGEDAVLARRGEPAPGVQSVGDMAGHRVGVQSGSVYETRLVEDLVEPGLTGPDDVVPYADAGQAASALASGAVDLAWGDRLPAEEASAALGLDIVALGLEQQRFAIALRHDDDELRTAINQALAALNSSGRLAVLSVEFLGLESAEVLPLPTAAPAQPVPTAVPPACEDGLEVVAHVTYDDHDLTQPPEVAPGQEFVKTWRVRNVGTCPWPAENIIRFVQGNTDAARMGGTDIELTEPVPAGDAIDVSLDLAAPLIPGLYVGFWEMAGTDGAGFGERMRVAVSVPVPPTPTPVPTLPPVREMQFDADRTVITAGESVTFSWNAPGATIAYFFRRGRDYRDYPVAPAGRRVASPDQTTTYVLRAEWPDGSADERWIEIAVSAPAHAPRIPWFTLSPEHRVALGRCVGLQWAVEGEVSTVRLTADGAALADNAPLSGYLQHCPVAVGTLRYAVVATGPGGTSRSEQDIDVFDPGEVLPTATPVNPATLPPEVRHFDVQPYDVGVGGCVAVTWELAGGVHTFSIKRNDVVVQDGGPLAGVAYDCLYSPGSYRYRLEAWSGANWSGLYARDEQVVRVR